MYLLGKNIIAALSTECLQKQEHPSLLAHYLLSFYAPYRSSSSFLLPQYSVYPYTCTLSPPNVIIDNFRIYIFGNVTPKAPLPIIEIDSKSFAESFYRLLFV